MKCPNRYLLCRVLLSFTAAILVGFAGTAAAQDKKPTKAADPHAAVTDPAQAGMDYAVQGEYTGEAGLGDVRTKFGVHVIAQGDGTFRATGYPGGLPGDGWDKKTRLSAEGKLSDEAVEFRDKGKLVLRYKGGSLEALEDGKPIGKLKKIDRTSPTLGAKPPEGAVVLFDGSTAEHFTGGRLTDDKLLMQGVTSKQKFGSCTLHLEFQLSYMPRARGQGRANSGCYLQGRYEVQILDSFGLEGKNNECGGIYGIKDPDENMCFPPLAWQTYDIEYTAAKYDEAGKKTADARMTVKHNGVVIHKDVALTKATTAAPVKEGPEPGPLYLQDHGNPIRFRNIWIVERK